MINVSDNYEMLFERLYRKGVFHFHENFDSLTLQEKHCTFEVTRRFLDVCRILNKYWPNTAKYVVAIHSERILEDVFSCLLDNSEETASLKEAIFVALTTSLVKIKEDNISHFLLQFEYVISQGKNIQLNYDFTSSNPTATVLFSTEFDFLNFYHTVDYYRRTSAPTILFKHIKLIKRATYAICNA